MTRKVYATTFRVKVSLIKDGNKYLVNDTLTHMVVDWYKERAHGEVLVQSGGFPDVVAITYLGRKNPNLEDMLADPDDDGNYPLRIDGQSYLVAGKKTR